MLKRLTLPKHALTCVVKQRNRALERFYEHEQRGSGS